MQKHVQCKRGAANYMYIYIYIYIYTVIIIRLHLLFIYLCNKCSRPSQTLPSLQSGFMQSNNEMFQHMHRPSIIF